MKKRIIIPIAALILLCGILTGIGILLSSQKPEKTSEKKTEKVEQELQTKPEETPGNPKQEQEKAASAKESEEQEEEPLSMDLSGFSSATGAQFLEPMLVRFSEGKYSMDCQLIFADGGNGIQPEDAQTKLTMDYFKEKKLLQIHNTKTSKFTLIETSLN